MLCEALGVQHPDYLMLNSKQLNDWKAYNLISPMGKWRNDWNFAALRQTVLAVNNNKRELTKLMPRWMEWGLGKTKALSEEESKLGFMRYAALMKSKKKKKERLKGKKR